MRTYSELIQIPEFKDRFDYVKLNGTSFGINEEVNRYFGQRFYHSYEWRQARNAVIRRDEGFDLAHRDHPILGRVLIHHLEPITMDDVISMSPKLFDPENLISVSHHMHNAIHYGDASLIPTNYVERTPGDTDLW